MESEVKTNEKSKTIVIQIGNSDNKLSQKEWANFIAETRLAVGSRCGNVHFDGGSGFDSKWQNMCIVADVYQSDIEGLAEDLSQLCVSFCQDSIAVTVGDTKFVTGPAPSPKTETDPGEGWRLVDKKKDKPQKGDQYWNDDNNRWEDRPECFSSFTVTDIYRRRIEPKYREPTNADAGNIVEVSDSLVGDWLSRELISVLAIPHRVNVKFIAFNSDRSCPAIWQYARIRCDEEPT